MWFAKSSLLCPPTPVDLRGADWDGLFDQVRQRIGASPRVGEYPLRQIVDVLTRLKCSDAVIDFPYDDQDLAYDYLQDYGAAFNDCGKTCVRIHFFAGIERLKELPELVKGLRRVAARSDKEDCYLGYMVMRPTGNACVGRTIIRSPYDDEEPVVHIHARAKYWVSLCGVHLAVKGVPFMQQDQSSHVCAGVALWTLSYDLHRRYRTPRFFPRQVTEIASGRFPFEGSGQGLGTPHMAHMLRNIGCAVDCSRAQLGDKPKKQRQRELRSFVSVAYGYIESNTSVLLGYRFKGQKFGHAVLLVGHDLCTDSTCPKDARPDTDKGQPHLDSDYVSRFIVQDDQKGPYQPLAIWNGTGTLPSAEEATKKNPRVLEDAELLFLMPGVTSAARMLYKPAFDQIKSVLDPNKAQDTALKNYFSSLLGGTRLRLYLQPARRFRALLLDAERGRAGLAPEHLKAYLSMRLPRHIFVCDFCAPHRNKPELLCVRGEVLLDATSRPYAREASVLACRTENCLKILTEPSLILGSGYNLDDPPRAPSTDIP